MKSLHQQEGATMRSHQIYWLLLSCVSLALVSSASGPAQSGSPRSAAHRNANLNDHQSTSHQSRPTQFAGQSSDLFSNQLDPFDESSRAFAYTARHPYHSLEQLPAPPVVARRTPAHPLQLPASNSNHNHDQNFNHISRPAALESSPVESAARATKLASSPYGKLAGHSSNSNQAEQLPVGSAGEPSGGLEFALRQAVGDESVLGAISAPGHAGLALGDWASSASTAAAGRTLEIAGSSSAAPATRQPAAVLAFGSTTTTATTSEQDNIVLNHEGDSSAAFNQLHTKQQHPMTREYPTNAGPLNVSSLSANNLDLLSNQLPGGYESAIGAAAPQQQQTGSAYYFSATEKDRASNGYNSNERAASNAWWAIGVGQEFERALNLTRDNYLDYCDRSALLVSNKQRALCRLHPRVMAVVARGLRLAIGECQARFASSRWNCSLLVGGATIEQPSASLATIDSGAQIFGQVMRSPNRERSYLNAIIAAGLAQSMTRACSAGELPDECSCDKKIRSKSNSRGRIEWVACSDDIDYGARFSRDFTDSTAELGEPDDMAATIYLHNNEVGRRVFKSATDITCTCAGSGGGNADQADTSLCQTKRCWKHLGSFADVGDELVKRYDSATHVQRSSKDPHKLRPVRRGVRRPKRKDLVYIAESPDYCQPDTRLGLPGTHNRRCNSTSSGADSCSLLCCGRGYQVVVDEIEEDCNCKFVWCCQVRCDRCKRQISSDVCN